MGDDCFLVERIHQVAIALYAGTEGRSEIGIEHSKEKPQEPGVSESRASLTNMGCQPGSNQGYKPGIGAGKVQAVIPPCSLPIRL